MPDGSLNENRKFKGRVVFLGDRVKDGEGYAAVLEELGASPASMEASKFCDMWGIMPGHSIESADAEQAYCQAKLLGTKQTWVRLPPWQHPDDWYDLAAKGKRIKLKSHLGSAVTHLSIKATTTRLCRLVSSAGLPKTCATKTTRTATRFLRT